MDEQEQSKLTPCPFCGGDGKMIHPMGEWVSAVIGYGPDGSRIACAAHDCTVYSPSFHGPDQDAQAIEWWNTRAPTPDAVNADKAVELERCNLCGTSAPASFGQQCNRPECGYRTPDKALMPEAAFGEWEPKPCPFCGQNLSKHEGTWFHPLEPRACPGRPYQVPPSGR